MPNYRRVYAEGHSYFITIVTHHRQKLLIKNIDTLRNVFAQSKEFYRYTILAIVVLPDHIHMIIEPESAIEYPKIISYIKRKFTYLLHQNPAFSNGEAVSHSRMKNRESTIWQRRYYEHTIRNQKDFQMHLDYIHYNPVKHAYVKSAGEWEYGSFQKYVDMGWYDRGWCDFSVDVSLGE